MAACTRELLTAWIVVWEVRTGAIVVSPPTIVEVVTIVVVLHGVVDLRIGIPEGWSFRLTRLKDGRRLAQEDVPEARRWRFGKLPWGDQKCLHQFSVLVEPQRLFDQRYHNHLAGRSIVILHQLLISHMLLIPGRFIVVIGLHCLQIGHIIVDDIDGRLIVIECLCALYGSIGIGAESLLLIVFIVQRVACVIVGVVILMATAPVRDFLMELFQ